MELQNKINKYLIIATVLLLLMACKSEKSESQTVVNQSGKSSMGQYERISQAPPADRDMEATDITIEIAGGQPGTYYLIGTFTDQYFTVDSASMQSGKIHFDRDKALPSGLYYVTFPNKTTNLQVLLDADQTFTMHTDANNLIASMKVNGNIDNELLYQTFKYEDGQKVKYSQLASEIEKYKDGDPEYQDLFNKRIDLNKEKQEYLKSLFKKHPTSLFTAFKEGGQNPLIYFTFKQDGTLDNDPYVYEYRNRFWENVNFADERLLRTPVISNKLNKYMTQLTPQNQDSIKKYASYLIDQTLDYDNYFKYFANWVTIKYEPTKTTLMDPEAVFVHMIQNYFTRERAFWADSMTVYGLQGRANEMAHSLLGQQGPNVTAANPQGEMKSLFDLKSDYLIVFMWNPNCEHCMKESPKLVNFYKEWHDKGVDVYGIAIDTDHAEWTETIKKYGMSWTNVFDPTNRAIYAKYYVDVTPELYVLNPERKIIGKNLKVDQVEIIINRDKENRR